MPKSYTERGFAIYDEFTDSDGGTVRIQQSSDVNGGVWLFGMDEGEWIGPELTDEQARRVVAALSEYLAERGGVAIG